MPGGHFPTLLRSDPRVFRYYVRTGVENVSIVRDSIHGRFRHDLSALFGDPQNRIVEQFVNSPQDIESVRRFVLSYGPLRVQAVREQSFQCTLSEFVRVQESLRNKWKTLTGDEEFELSRGGSLRFHAGQITHDAATLENFLLVDLLTAPVDRVRVCKREGCIHPYFITTDLKRTFCSVECSEEARRQSKRDWYEEHGKAWHANRRATTKTKK